MDKISRRSEVSGSLHAPSSKSYAQRAVAAALLASGETRLLNMEFCSDTRAALSVIQSLGATVRQEDETSYIIKGGLEPHSGMLDIGESGLSTRMFTPIAALCEQPLTVTGHGSILSRPIDMMLDPLRQLGVRVTSNDGFLPVTVCGPLRGGAVTVDGSVSSQFVTGLLMALPLAASDTVMHVPHLNSIPYINMTIDVLKQFDVLVEHNSYREFFVRGGQEYCSRVYNIEGDWSGASCLLVAGAIAGEITVTNLNSLSLQADVAIIDALARAGAEIITSPDRVTVKRRSLHGFAFDATHCPDLFPALAALAANCAGESLITGTERLAHKESNRAETIQQEFGKMGIEIDLSQENVMRIVGGQPQSAEVDSHNDHRIAMSAAVAALNAEGDVRITGAECVAKSYPGFWEDLESVLV